jgi:hypothetical protein
LTTTNSQLAAARGQVALDQVNLFLALGGGWEMEPQDPAKAAAAPVAASASAASQ